MKSKFGRSGSSAAIPSWELIEYIQGTAHRYQGIEISLNQQSSRLSKTPLSMNVSDEDNYKHDD